MTNTRQIDTLQPITYMIFILGNADPLKKYFSANDDDDDEFNHHPSHDTLHWLKNAQLAVISPCICHAIIAVAML